MQWLSDPTVIAVSQFVWGLLVKRLPVLATWPNKYIPLMNTVLGFIFKLVGGPASAVHASFTSSLFSPCETYWSLSATAHGFQTAGFFSFLSAPPVAKLLDAGWSAILVALFHDKFGAPIYEPAPPTAAR